MSEQTMTVVTVKEQTAQTATAAAVQPWYLQDRTILYVQVLAIVLMLVLFVAYPAAASPDPDTTINIDPDAVRDGIFSGANLIFGAGILGIILLPAGIRFGLNLIGDLVGAFSDIRLGR
jgi:hypothetical protein